MPYLNVSVLFQTFILAAFIFASPSTFQLYPSLVKTVVSLEGPRTEESVLRNDHPCCLIRPSLYSTNRGGIFWSVLREMWIGRSFLKGVVICYYSKTAQTS